MCKIAKKLTTGLFSLLLLLLPVGCDSPDCTLNNNVLCHFSFYNGEGQKIALNDTLTILAYGTDQVLYNRGVNKAEVAVPMSFYNSEDTFILQIVGKEYAYEAEVAVKKTNIEHFESVDCPVKMFHTIRSAYILGGQILDSVAVIKSSVNFQQDENIRLYFHTQ